MKFTEFRCDRCRSSLEVISFSVPFGKETGPEGSYSATSKDFDLCKKCVGEMLLEDPWVEKVKAV